MGRRQVLCTKAREIDLAEYTVDPRAPEWAEFRNHYPTCPQCARAVAEISSIKTAVRAEHRAASAHSSEADLIALASPSSHLPPSERARLQAHLAGCAPCRTEFAVLQRYDFAAVTAERVERSALDRFMEAIQASLLRPALVAAAIAVIAIPIAVMLWRSPRETAPIPTPPVAVVEPSPLPVAREAVPPPAPPEVAATVPTPPAIPSPAVRPEPAAVAEEGPPQKPPSVEPPSAIEIAALLPADPPQYVPGALASGPTVRVGDSARSLGAEIPPPVALGPAQIGATAHESPNLYWFLPRSTELSIEVTLIDPNASEPLLEAMLPGPHRAGVHRVNLAERGVRLPPGVDYQWFVALVRDEQRRSQDAVSGAAIRYDPPRGDLASRLSAPPPGRAAHLFAEAGYWYDSFDQLSSWLATERDESRLHQHRAALLDQVELGDVAAFERR
jgi:Domain of Unknown Function (DUF928)/Putative zinc-finger